MDKSIVEYNSKQEDEYKKICEFLADLINNNLSDATNKVWHGHPVWFLKENPTVGYSVRKNGVQILFWSGQSFKEEKLEIVGSTKFKAAGIYYQNVAEIDSDDIKRWLKKSEEIQWDYKNIVKRKGKLIRL